MVVTKKVLFLLLMALIATGLAAQSISVRSSLRKEVISISEQLQLVLIITSDQKLSLSAPSAPVIPGFSFRNVTSSSSSKTSIVNWKKTSSHTYEYTYHYTPQRTGSYVIPGFSINIGKIKYNTDPLEVEVVDSPSSPPGQYNQDPYYDPYSGGFYRRDRTNGVSLLLCIPERQSVYLGEPAIISYYLYTNQMVESFYSESEKDYEGYGKAVLEQPKSLEYEDIMYEGERFQRALIKKVTLYPQATGRLRAPTLAGKVNFTGFFSFLNKSLSSENTWIEVRALPAGKPRGFTGAVGDFTVSQQFSTDKISLGEALTSTVKISGQGNFSQFNVPGYPALEEFQVSEPSLQDKLATDIQGSRYINFTLLPQTTGEFGIPGYTFSWFDTSEGVYRKFEGPKHKLSVKTGNVLSYFSDLFQEEKPKTLNPLIARADYPDFRPYASQPWFWIFLGVLAISLLISGYISRERNIRRMDPNAYTKKKASRILNKYLREATDAVMNMSTRFYPLAESGLMNFLANKYSISKSLSTPELLSALKEKGIPQDLVAELEDFLLLCQKARYMPGGNEAASLTDALARLRSVVQGFSRIQKQGMKSGLVRKIRRKVFKDNPGNEERQ